jgi:hypothetical protein
MRGAGGRLTIFNPRGGGLTFSAVIVFSSNTEDVVVSFFAMETLPLSVIRHAGEFGPQPLVILSLFSLLFQVV